MGKESQIESFKLSPLAQRKVEELVALLAEEEFGDGGRPPIDTDFASIEDMGHQAGRRVAQALDEHLTRRHAEHFQEPQATCCPCCGRRGDSAEKPKERRLCTGDGPVTLSEPAFHCSTCQRAFFPSADGIKD